MAKESQNKQNIHDGHRDRMRNRFLKVGLEGFDEHEILEFILFHSIARIDTNALAHKLITEFGSLSSVLNAPIEQLQKVKGIGKNSAVLINFIRELTKSDLSSLNCAEPLNNGDKAGEYAMSLFTDFSVESVFIISLDEKFRPICTMKLSEGGLDKAIVSTQSMARFLLSSGAWGAIIAHNHPRGLAVPSVADLRATTSIKTVLDTIGIKLIDHIIVVSDDFTSLRDSGDRLYTTFD